MIAAGEQRPSFVARVERTGAWRGGQRPAAGRAGCSSRTRRTRSAPLAVVAEPARPLGDGGVVRDDRAAVAERTEVLGRIEAEGGRVAERSRAAAPYCRAVRLRRVLDDVQPVLARDASRSASMSAHWPYRCTGDDRRASDADRVARATPGRACDVRSSTSTSTGVAPAASIPATVGTHVFAAVITSSPGSTPSGVQRDRDRVGARGDADRVRARRSRRRTPPRTRSTRGPEDEDARRRARASTAASSSARTRPSPAPGRGTGRPSSVPERRAVLAVERERTLEAFLELDRGLPAERLLDLPASRRSSRRCRSPCDRSGNGTSL